MVLDIWNTLLAAFSAICPVNCHLCVLKQRPDPSQGGKLTWSLPYDERCLCQAVVAPRWRAQSCGAIDEYGDMKLWYVDDPRPLTNRVNWNKEVLDALLDRVGYQYCGCIEPVGMEDGRIPDNQITATDYWDENWTPYKARLNNNRFCWSSHLIHQNQYIQVVLNQPQYLGGVITQGCSTAWVTHYKVEISPDDTNWEYVSDTTGGPPKIFDGNTDDYTAVTNYFHERTLVSTIRIHVWPETVRRLIHMRLEFLGCPIV